MGMKGHKFLGLEIALAVQCPSMNEVNLCGTRDLGPARETQKLWPYKSVICHITNVLIISHKRKQIYIYV